MKKLLSLLFPILLLLIISLALVYRFASFSSAQIWIICSYLLWIVYELYISKRDYIEKSKMHTDGNTREVYAIAHGLTTISAIWLSGRLENTPMLIIGIIIYCSGIVVRIWSTRSLGIYYSHNARVMKNHKIVNTGPYKIVRHPAYSGMILIHIGILILFFNFVTLLILCVLLIPTILYRIAIEEKLLFVLPEYGNKFKDKKRLLPFVW